MRECPGHAQGAISPDSSRVSTVTAFASLGGRVSGEGAAWLLALTLTVFGSNMRLDMPPAGSFSFLQAFEVTKQPTFALVCH